jgi:glycogen debranching enzyme
MSNRPDPLPRLVDLGPGSWPDVATAASREWLVTNGLGGYAFGTTAGAPSRTYHGWLIAALQPPVGRTLLVGPLEERATVDGRTVALHALELADGTVVGEGLVRLRRLRLEGGLPVWTFDAGGAELERRAWMPAGRNVTRIRYANRSADRTVDLEVVPLLAARDHHDAGESPARVRVASLDARTARLRLGSGTGRPLRIETDTGGLDHAPDGVAGPFELREEAARGQAHRAVFGRAVRLRVRLQPGASVTLSLAADGRPLADADRCLGRAIGRQRGLLRRARATRAPEPIRQLVLAADQFLVRRRIPREDGTSEAGRSVIAGYPWFNDWGRDTMIAIPGLCLATGRADEAKTILRSFARFRRDGLLPNEFPDRMASEPSYHTVDASLWFVVALAAVARATGDRALVDDLLPGIVDSIAWHVRGTRFGIGVDPTDGLLREGAEGYQLTWMDAKVDGWVVTPRRGKPVEIQALWHETLRLAAGWLRDRGDAAAADGLDARADLVRASFLARFWRPELGHLADVIDGPDGDALPHPLVDDPNVARAVVATCGRELLVPCALRSLAPSDPSYRPRFQGDRRFRDAAYHQGTGWTWLVGPYADALFRVTGDRAAVRAALGPFVAHLSEAGLGTVSENVEPEPPFTPRTCVAQAWGVAEVLRVWRSLEPLEPLAP